MNYSKWLIFAIFLGSMTTFVPKNTLLVKASSGANVLRFAQDDLGHADQNLSDFNLQGSGVTVSKNTNKGLIMTTGGGQASSIFLKEQLAADASSPGFSTYFVMNVYKLTPGPADGYVFVIAANSNSLGALGGGLGYSGISNSVGIEFDFYDNGGENMASSDVFTNGSPSSTAGTVFDSGYISRWNSVSTGALVRAFHTWIEYDYAQSRLELRVATSNNESPSTSRPTRPVNALLSKTASYSQISNFFYAGFTAATGGLMQQMTLKSWYLSNAYIPGGIDPDNADIVVDKTPPTEPTITTNLSNQQYSLSISGGTDDAGIAGYQYKLPAGTWQNYTNPINITSIGEYQARTVDQAGNYSTTVASIWLYQIHFSAGGTIRQSVYRVNTDVDYSVEYEYFDGTYLYQDWYLNNSYAGDKVTSIASRTTSITLYGKPIQNVFTIDYVLDGGSVAKENPSFYVKDTTLILNNPSKEGHTFAGWYLNDALTIAFNPASMPTTNFILYAAYDTNLYTLSLYMNDDANTVSTIDLPYQTLLDPTLTSYETAIANHTYEKVGHTFGGWYLDENLTTPWIEGTSLFNNTAIYAEWSIQSFDVTYKLNDHDLYLLETLTFGSTIVFPNQPILEGFTFEGWRKGEAWFADGSLMPAQSITLTASWSRNQYSLSFQTNQGTAIEGISLPFETPIEDHLPTGLTKEGYSFGGWYLDESLLNPLPENALILTSTTLFAKWDVNAYELSFETNGGSLINAVTFNYGSPIALPLPPTQEGYTFTGWYQDELLSQPYEAITMPAKNVTLFAGWMINLYRIQFNFNNGETSLSSEYAFQQSLPDLINPIREGHTFQGWYIDEAFMIPFDFKTMPSQDLNLYAKWEINSYQLSFSSSHLSQPYLTTPILFGQAPILPIAPSREGFVFLGWQADGILVDQTWTMPSHDVTLTAVWQGLSSQVIFVTAHETTILVTTSGEAIGSLPTVAMKPGYVFIGWSLALGDASQIIDASYVVENGLTLKLYPIWEQTNNPTILLNQYLALGMAGIQSYTYEIFIFSSIVLIGFIGFILYRKRVQYGE